VVWNLLANAVKFTEAEGIVSVDVLDAGIRGIHITVHDDGAGISPEFLPHVFERFRQADGSVSRQHGGLGLGLAIVRHLVELHGGTVHADSPGPGEGSTFTVELPRADPDVRASPDERRRGSTVDALQPRRRPALAGCRVLVVDDQDDARELMATILTNEGAHVDTASSVADALRQLDIARPDAILADIGMPGADGYVLIREVRKRDAQSGLHLPTAAITAYAGDRDREHAMAAGFDCHVPKPITGSAIVDAVISICQGTNPTS
jgi:CheY-like chemotaxis protein